MVLKYSIIILGKVKLIKGKLDDLLYITIKSIQ